MEIVHVYQKKRSEFGRQCIFSEEPPSLIIDIEPNPKEAEEFIQKNPCELTLQEAPEFSEHEVNTERYETEDRGVNHVEGGWPKDVDASEVEQTMRFRKKVEKDENYIASVQNLGAAMTEVIMENNSLDIYEDYFPEKSEYKPMEIPEAKTVNVFRDPNDIKRSASSISWYPDGPKKVAVAYSILEFQQAPAGVSLDSYVWDVENPNQPEMTLTPTSPLVSIEYSPKDPHCIAGGYYNGQVAAWDTRKGSKPIAVSPIEKSHRDPSFGLGFIQSKGGTEFFSTSTDGQVLWWDIKNGLTEPIDTMPLNLDIIDEGNNGRIFGGISLEYDLSMPTKFMIGTEQGTIISCNRKSKTPAERIVAQYKQHHGPIYSLERNPFYPKYFLSVADWTARIWSEDLKESSIAWTKYHTSYLTAGMWSPTRPAVFFTTKMDGTLDVWDYLFKQSDATLSVQVSDKPITSLAVEAGGASVCCGDKDGTLTLLELSDGLSCSDKEERTQLLHIFERESAREKILEARNREVRLKKAQAEAAAAAAAKKKPQQNNEEEEEEDPIEVAEKEFAAAMEAFQAKKEKEAAKKAEAEAAKKAALEAVEEGDEDA